MRTSSPGVSSVADRTGVRAAGAARDPDTRRAGSHPLKRALLIRRVCRYQQWEGHITRRLSL